LQHQPGVHYVLRGRTPVHVLADLRRRVGSDLLDEREDGIADGSSALPHRLEVDLLDYGLVYDRARGVRWNHSELALDLRQLALDLQPSLDVGALREDRAHLRIPEDIEQRVKRWRSFAHLLPLSSRRPRLGAPRVEWPRS